MNHKSISKRSNGSELSKTDIQSLKDSIKGHVVVKSEATEEEYKASVLRWNQVYIKQAVGTSSLHIVSVLFFLSINIFGPYETIFVCLIWSLAQNYVVYVAEEADITTCIDFVTKHNVDVAVAGGRHSYHGASSSEGLVIDLQKMRKVTVDKASKTVTAQGGCVAADVEQPADAQGLSVVFGAFNETGIGGLTLGGGVGWLTGVHGLTIDNLLSARIAIANGEVVTASKEQNADLFWAIRGAGPNFGIVTEFTYRAHDQGPVFMDMLIFTPDRLPACIGLLNKLREEAIKPAQGKLQIMLALMAPPSMPMHCPGFMVFYNGPESEARELAKPIYDLEPVHSMGGTVPYSKTTELPAAMRMSGHDRYAASSAYMDWPLDEKLVQLIFERFQAAVAKHGKEVMPSACIMDLRDYRKVASVPVSEMAYASRHDTALIVPDYRWDDPKMDETMREEAREFTAFVREKLQELRVAADVQDDGQRDVTAMYPNVSSGVEKVKSVYGPNLERLQTLKKKYDPDCMWNKWYPITPV